ncbi:MAG: type II toxin-antitoxin system RelE/ParE family toxin [Myxococcota bacterium]
MKIRILDAARIELREAVTWYDSRRTGLGKEFKSDVLTKLRFLRRLPLSSPIWPKDPRFRCATLTRFPYRIFYFTEDSDALVVVSIAHDRRQPGYWRTRVP